MDRKTLKKNVSESLQELTPKTVRNAADVARDKQKFAQANRLYAAAEKREGANFENNLTQKLGTAPRTFKMELPTGAISVPKKLSDVTLTGMFERGNSLYIKFESPTWFGLSKNKDGLIIYIGKDGTFLVSPDGLNSMPSNTKFDRNGVIAMHKLTGLPNERIPKLDNLSEQREVVKAAIRKLVIKEMTQADFGTGKVATVGKLEKDVKKSVGKAGEVETNPLSNKIVVDDEDNGNTFQCQVTENGKGLYDVTVVKNGGDYFRGRQLSADKLAEFLKTHSKEDDSYTDKAFKKGKAPIKNKEEEMEEVTSEVDDTDEMEETKEETQVKIADKETTKAEEKSDKDVAPIEDENAPQLGGELVDKIERIIDKVLKDKTKAEPKSAYLKADSKMESPDKLGVKLKDTPALKKKVNEDLNRLAQKGEVPVWMVHIPANVYDGKYYDHRTYRMLVPITDEIKTEQDAIKWVNDHKQEVLARADRSRVGHDKRRRVKFPVEKNLFFKPSYTVDKSKIWNT